jgi:tripartite-type tricarboxylate transporter receptor subunit TctC
MPGSNLISRKAFLRSSAGGVLAIISGRFVSPGYAAQSVFGLIKLTIPTARGGINDLAGRLVARHLGRFLPGGAAIEATNDERGGVALANRFAAMVQRDALEIAIVQRAVPQLAIQGDKSARFDPLKLNWLGSLSSFANDAYMLIVNARHPAKTVWDLAPPAPPALIGGDAPGSTNLIFALIAKEALKLNIDVKDGFSGAAGMFFAMRDGDLDGQVIGLNSLMANQPELWRGKDVRPLLQFGRRTRHPLLKDVPLAGEYTHDRDALRLVAFAEAPLSMALPFVAPASLPADRAQMLQRAFASMARDRDFLADAERVKLDITPVSGERVHQTISQMAATPKDLIARYNAMTMI